MPTAGESRTPRSATPRGGSAVFAPASRSAANGGTTPRSESRPAATKAKLPEEARGKRRPASVAAPASRPASGAAGVASAGSAAGAGVGRQPAQTGVGRTPSPGFGSQRRSPTPPPATKGHQLTLNGTARIRREPMSPLPAPMATSILAPTDELLQALGPGNQGVDAGTGGVSLSGISLGDEAQSPGAAALDESWPQSGASTPRLAALEAVTAAAAALEAVDHRCRWLAQQPCDAHFGNGTATVPLAGRAASSRGGTGRGGVGGCAAQLQLSTTAASATSQAPENLSFSEKSNSENVDLQRRMEDLERCMASLASENRRLRASIEGSAVLAGGASARAPRPPATAPGLHRVPASTGALDGSGMYFPGVFPPQRRVVPHGVASGALPRAPSLPGSVLLPLDRSAAAHALSGSACCAGNTTPPSGWFLPLESARSVTPPPRVCGVARSTSTPTFSCAAPPAAAPPWAHAAGRQGPSPVLVALAEPIAVQSSRSPPMASPPLAPGALASRALPPQFVGHPCAMGACCVGGCSGTEPAAFAPAAVPAVAMTVSGVPVAMSPPGPPGSQMQPLRHGSLIQQPMQAPTLLAMPHMQHAPFLCDVGRGNDTVYARLGEVLRL